MSEVLKTSLDRSSHLRVLWAQTVDSVWSCGRKEPSHFWSQAKVVLVYTEWSQTSYILVLNGQGVLSLKGTCGGEPPTYNINCLYVKWFKKWDAPLREISKQLHQSWCEGHTIEGATAALFWGVRVHVLRRYRGERKKWGCHFLRILRNQSMFFWKGVFEAAIGRISPCFWKSILGLL